MLAELISSFRNEDAGLRHRIVLISGGLVLLNLVSWGIALICFSRRPELLATCLLAWGFGLRHAVDADHIAAIDNVTRKLMQEKEKPVAVGFFFSLGHSSVVTLMTLAIVIGVTYLSVNNPGLMKVGGLIGTIVSGSFLLLIAFINLVVFLDIFRMFRDVQAGKPHDEETLETFLQKRGFFARFFRPLYRSIHKSWHMYPVGFLFGLGFDTATEIGLLGIAATQVGTGLNPWTIMIFPLLFTAGMSLVDTLDGILMVGAYGWAFVNPVRKLFYNMVITLVSLLIAGFIGGMELLGIIAERLDLTTGFWYWITALNEHFSYLGFFIIGVFVLSWFVSTVIYRKAGFEERFSVATTGKG